MFETLFRNTLSGWQWSLMALVPLAIIALYFLKLKRQPLEVPSTFLWRRTIEDLHVNSLWQRLRRSILLFLQLLLILLAMIALLRPGWQTEALEGERFILMLDNSASMSADDMDGSRLAEAKQRALGTIDQMESGSDAMIITFAGRPQVVQQFTENRNLLRKQVESIEPTNEQTRLLEALRLADGLANPSRITNEEGDQEFALTEEMPATVYIFSDGRFGPVEGFSLGNLTPKFIPIGTAEAANLAVTTVTTRREDSRPQEQQAFARVLNATPEDRRVEVEMYIDGARQDAIAVEVPANESAPVVFPLANAPPGALKIQLSADRASDVLSLDDAGYAAIDEGRRGKVLLISSGANKFLERALSTERAERLAEVDTVTPSEIDLAKAEDPITQRLAVGHYDLVVFDRFAPALASQMPRANTVFIGAVPPLAAWRTSQPPPEQAAGQEQPPPPAPPQIAAPDIIDWSRIHPAMALVELGDVLIVESFELPVPPGGTPLIEAAGGQGDGVIAAIAPRDQFEDLVLGFGILDPAEGGLIEPLTDWPRRHSFPVFWLNVLGYLGGHRDEAGLSAIRPGDPVELVIPGSANELAVILPSGGRRTIRRGQHELFQFQETDQLGVYQVVDGGNVVRRFAVNLFDPLESDIAVRQRTRTTEDGEEVTEVAPLRINYVEVEGDPGWKPVRRELWRWLLMAALLVLLVEWYIYNRRVYL